MATQINPYLTFDGNCEEAFAHYKKTFGGEFTNISRFSEMPPMPGMTPDPKDGNRVMNMGLPINDHTILYGSDSNPAMGKAPIGKNVSLSITPESREHADKLFKMLSEGGTVTMPMGDMFWGAYFGMCDDKFGVSWMINLFNK